MKRLPLLLTAALLLIGLLALQLRPDAQAASAAASTTAASAAASTTAASADPGVGLHLKGLDADAVDWSAKDTAYWKATLSPAQFKVCREAGTERPFSGALLANHEPGTFACSGCGQALFPASAKFKSGTGWPSFHSPVSKDAVTVNVDMALGMLREEVVCSRCQAHLGHVFNDGPAPTGKRYCINSVCMVHLE